MVSVKVIKRDHEKIIRSLSEIEEVLNKINININNFSHKFNNFNILWDSHEKREEKWFKRFKGDKFGVFAERFVFEHRELKGHNKVIKDAIKSGDELKVRIALDTDGRILINKLRTHIGRENELFNINS